MERNISRREVLAAAAACTLSAPLLTVSACDGARTPLLHDMRGHALGSTYRVRYRPPSRGWDAIELQRAVTAALARVDARLSIWRPDAELARLNAAPCDRWLSVSAETLAVLEAAQALREKSGGTFDARTGALVDLWGFGPGRRPRALPSHAAVDRLRARLALAPMDLRAEPPSVRKPSGTLPLDLGAIGQGHAVDVLISLLASRRVEHALVEVGGELRALGERGPGRPWCIAVARPTVRPAGPLCRILLPSGTAVATSGLHARAFQHGRRRYGHVLDPRTGGPVEHDLVATSVLAPSAREADALATALLVLGSGEGRAWARSLGLAALLVHEDAGGLRLSTTPAFDVLQQGPEART